MDDIVLITAPINRQQLKEIASRRFGDMVKGVVDIEKAVMALGAELHADEVAYLLEKGSIEQNLWGINLYPDLEMPQMLEFNSMVNIKPSQNNRSRLVESPTLQVKIQSIVEKLIQ
jgi:hypothetical protein